MASSVVPSPGVRSSGWTAKQTFWLVLGLAVVFVFLLVEVPTFTPTADYAEYYKKLVHDRWLLIPHALGGLTALLLGPIQFSSRIRQRHLKFHRITGRVYVGAVFVAATLALMISHGGDLFLGTSVQAGAWMFCTLAALLTARNRQIAKHRQWMIRSYAVTFTFISLRLLNPWAAYRNMSNGLFVSTIILATFLSVFLPDIAFSWRELTTRRG